MTTTPRRYALFLYDTYYPSGGMHDLVGFFDTSEEAAEVMKERLDDHTFTQGHVVDLTDGRLMYDVDLRPGVSEAGIVDRRGEMVTLYLGVKR